MLFKVGDNVIHPRHGLGKISQLAVKEFVEGQKRIFFEISFPGSTLWVPLNLSNSGIRKITVKSEIEKCRKILASPAVKLNGTPRLRMFELNERIKKGTLTETCRVVRDLSAHGWHASLNGTFVSFLSLVQEVLCQEWAAVEEISLEQASNEIIALLEMGKRLHGNVRLSNEI